MILYAESNLLLEVALAQEQAEAARGLIALAETGKVRLIVPILALVEPIWTLTRKHQERLDLWNRLDADIRQLGRSAHSQDVARSLMTGIQGVRDTAPEEDRLYDELLVRLVGVAEFANLDTGVLLGSDAVRDVYGLGRLDALMLTSILVHLQAASPDEEKLFVSRDKKAFERPDILARLGTHRCTYVSSFDAAFQRLQSAQA